MNISAGWSSHTSPSVHSPHRITHSVFMSNSPGMFDSQSGDVRATNHFSTQSFSMFGILADSERGEELLRRVELYTAQRHADEHQNTVNELLDPNSHSQMQVMMSYMVLLLSNGLMADESVDSFVLFLDEVEAFVALAFIDTITTKIIVTRILHAAVRVNAISILRLAVKRGLDLEAKSTGKKGETLLQKAIVSKNVSIARLLVEAGADLNVRDTTFVEEYERCPAHRYTRLSAADYYGVDNFYCHCEREGRRSLLALAASTPSADEFIPLLLERKVTCSSYPVVLQAVRNGASEASVRALLQAGGSADDCSPWDRPASDCPEIMPLSIAAERGQVVIAELLLDRGAAPDGPLRQEFFEILSDWRYHSLDRQFRSPLMLAIETGDAKMVELLLEHGANPNASVLGALRLREVIEADESLMGYGFDDDVNIELKINELFNYDDSEDLLLLSPLQVAASLEHPHIAEILLKHGAEVDIRFGTPPLAVAAYHSRLDTIQLLLSWGASPCTVYPYIWSLSALEAAVHAQNAKAIELLLSAGADINHCSPREGGRTPLQKASEIGKSHNHPLSVGVRC